MQSRRRRVAVVVIGCALSTVACTPSPVAPPPAVAPPAVAPSPTPAASTNTAFASAAPLAETIDYPNQLEKFDPAQFSNSATIDNAWFPLTPGTQLTYEGFTVDDEGKQLPHRFVQTVSDMTKVIDGVRTVVVWDQDFEDGVLVEAELAFNAQSDAGEVWRLGEYPEVYEGGEIVETPTWISGIAGARPGITMRKDPQLGPSYSQGWAPTVPWTDRARVGQVGVADCVPVGCHQNVIVTEEFNREEPGAIQLKYYAPGVGNTRVGFTGADNLKETLELVSVVPLDATGLAEVRAQVLALEKSGYERSRAVYALTAPAEQRPPAG